MSKADHVAAEKTYRAIGRFIFQFSQAEYTIRHYLAEEISLAEEHFVAVVESYDVALLCTVAKEVFGKSRANTNAAAIMELINNFRSLTDNRNRVAHGLWVPFKDAGTVHHVPRTNLKSRMAAIRLRRWKSSPTRRVAFALSWSAHFCTPHRLDAAALALNSSPCAAPLGPCAFTGARHAPASAISASRSSRRASSASANSCSDHSD